MITVSPKALGEMPAPLDLANLTAEQTALEIKNLKCILR